MLHRLIPGALHEPGGAVRRCNHLMEGAELQPDRKCLQSFPKLPLWIIEYAWTHNMIDMQTVVDPFTWPEMDSQSLSLDDSWRLRVISAKVYFIVRNRDMVQFERVMGFLEATHILLPRLVSPIKHMKIMFGLKTMFIMWMLREGRGMVDIVIKINQFFPSKLPQYQDQCSPHEMFLMRKNNEDFKTLARALAVNKDKLKDYILNQMEPQYGEHYAQRVEDRLLHYLHKLKAVLPGDTFIDKILKKGSPVTEEEQLLLDVISSDPATIATTLKKLLHCDVVSCSLGKTYQSSLHAMENSQLSQYSPYGSSSKAPLKSVEARTPEFKPEVLGGEEEDDQDVSKDNLWFEKENDSDAGRHQQTEEGSEVDKRVKEGNSDREKEEISQRSSECFQEATSSPQFCSKHQRWVKSILQECPDECSEELHLQANVSQSPPLFQSSSSITSSGDLTPSDLILHPPDQQQPPTQTSIHFETAVQACEQTNLEDKPNSGSLGSYMYTSQREPLPQPPSSRDTPLPALLLPVVRLKDIATVRGIHLTFKLHQSSSNHFTMCSNKQAASASSPQVQNCPDCSTSGNDTIPQRMQEDQPNTVAPTNAQNTTHQVQKSPVSHYASTSTSCQPQTPPSFPRLSRKFRLDCMNRKPQTFDEFCQNPLAEQLKRAPATLRTNSLPLSLDYNTSRPPTHDVSTSTSQSTTISSVYTANQVVPQSFIQSHPQTHISPSQLKTLRYSNVVSCTPNSSRMVVRSKISRDLRAQFRLSLSSQAMLLQSKLLQPYVSLTRLSGQECYQMTNGRSSIRFMEPVAQGSDDNDEDADSSFDPYILYSSHSSSNDSKDSLDDDPDYKPYIKKKKLLVSNFDTHQ